MSTKRSRRAPARAKSRAVVKRAPSGRPRTRLELMLGLGDAKPKKKSNRSSKSRRRKPARGGRSGRNNGGSRASGAWHFLGRTTYWGAVVGIWAALILGSVTAYFVSTLPDPLVSSLEKRPPNVTILASDGTVLAEHGARPGHVKLDRLPPYLVDAVLAIEDRRYRSHFGVDPVGLTRALWRNYRAGTVVEGGSTITQQLAKNLFLTPERTIGRKFQEMVLAVWLETKFSKDEILEIYLNRVYFGAGTYGVEAAAKRYFGKSARTVTVAESALLAGLLKAPSRYAPTRSPRRAEKRASIVLAAMVDAGFLPSKKAMAALAQPARVRNPSGLSGYEYAVDWVVEQMPDLVGEYASDLVVETTIDAKLQRNVQRIVSLTMAGSSGFVDADQVSAVVLDRRGGVRALVGGQSYKASQFNRAVKSLRQPGSAFKPIVYLAALESGLRPNSVIEDKPVAINGWRPKNHDGTFAGPVSLKDALARSINTVAVRLTMEVGRWRVIRTARRLGIDSPLHDRPSIALGTAEVTLLELTGAYVPFANGGEGVFPHIVKRIRTASGKTLFSRNSAGPGRVVALPYVGAMNDMMAATISEGTGKAAAIGAHRAAGKTGTSQSFRDAWFMGYTGHLVAGVWVGNDDASPMKKVTGGGLPAQIWRAIMTEAHRGRAPVRLPGTAAPMIATTSPSARADQPVAPPSHIEEPFLRRVFGALRPGS